MGVVDALLALHEPIYKELVEEVLAFAQANPNLQTANLQFAILPFVLKYQYIKQSVRRALSLVSLVV